MGYAILTIDPSLGLVKDFNDEHLIVQTCEREEDAMAFASDTEAREWAETMSGAGFGLGSYEIVAISR
jgi:hypothetical protein